MKRIPRLDFEVFLIVLLIGIVLLFYGCSTSELCRKMWDGNNFRCMTPEENCHEQPWECRDYD
jgi:hypothetical protein